MSFKNPVHAPKRFLFSLSFSLILRKDVAEGKTIIRNIYSVNWSLSEETGSNFMAAFEEHSRAPECRSISVRQPVRKEDRTTFGALERRCQAQPRVVFENVEDSNAIPSLFNIQRKRRTERLSDAPESEVFECDPGGPNLEGAAYVKIYSSIVSATRLSRIGPSKPTLSYDQILLYILTKY